MATQQKDIIYIDVEDDITAIIGKVKASKQKIVALVPPKRTGVLQSAVNLKLLARTADSADKRLVLITGNSALAGLAASADIPVAKNLQSRPEMAKTPSVTADDEDIIEGGQLPVGDHAGLSDTSDEEKIPETSIEDLNIDGEPAPVRPKRINDEKKPSGRKGIAVPDFGSFRKRLAFGVGGGVLLIAFLVWAIAFAPRATIVVSAKTTGQSLTTPVTLGADLTTDSEKATIKSIKQEEKVKEEVEFEATGEKDVGEKATGAVTFSTNQISLIGATIPSGTHVTASNGKVFVTTESITFTFPGGTSKTAGIVAAESGTDYNDVSGDVTGAPSGVDAEITTATSGGTTKMVKVVTQGDVQKAKEQLAEQNKTEAVDKLKEKFSDGDVIIEESLTTSGGDPVSSPAIGKEASNGKATLTSEVTYTMVAISKDELNEYLDGAFETTLTDTNKQRVYKNGIDEVAFQDFTAGKDDKDDTVTVMATAQIGPKIDDNEIKDQAKGRKSGEVIGEIKAIDGVSDVEVKLSPFWVGGVPDDVNKISVEFKLLENG